MRCLAGDGPAPDGARPPQAPVYIRDDITGCDVAFLLTLLFFFNLPPLVFLRLRDRQQPHMTTEPLKLTRNLTGIPPPPDRYVDVFVNGVSVKVPCKANLVEACRLAGVYVPTLCYHPRLQPIGATSSSPVKPEWQHRWSFLAAAAV
jgi:hypothetical protein